MPDDRPPDVPPVEESLAQLHRAGWSIGDTTLATEGGGLVWVVSGSNGENLNRVEGPMCAVAWPRAAEQAWALGRLGRLTGW